MVSITPAPVVLAIPSSIVVEEVSSKVEERNLLFLSLMDEIVNFVFVLGSLAKTIKAFEVK